MAKRKIDLVKLADARPAQGPTVAEALAALAAFKVEMDGDGERVSALYDQMPKYYRSPLRLDMWTVDGAVTVMTVSDVYDQKRKAVAQARDRAKKMDWEPDQLERVERRISGSAEQAEAALEHHCTERQAWFRRVGMPYDPMPEKPANEGTAYNEMWIDRLKEKEMAVMNARPRDLAELALKALWLAREGLSGSSYLRANDPETDEMTTAQMRELVERRAPLFEGDRMAIILADDVAHLAGSNEHA